MEGFEMNRLFYLWIITAVCLLINVVLGFEESWKIVEPKNTEEVTANRTKLNEELAQAKKQKSDAEKLNNIDEKDLADLRIARAQYNLETVNIAERLIKNEDPLISPEQKKILQEEISALEEKKLLYAKTIAALTQDLSGLLSVDTGADVSVSSLSDRLKTVFSSPGSLDLKNRALRDISNTSNFDQKMFIAELKKESDFDKKLMAVRERRLSLDLLRKQLETEQSKISDLTTTRENIAYNRRLEDLKNKIINGMNEIDRQSLTILMDKEKNQPGFFARLARSFKAWYDRTFAASKPPLAESIVQEIKAIKKTIDPLLWLETSLENLQGRVAALSGRSDAIAKTDDAQAKNNIKQEIDDLRQQISLVEKSFRPQDKELLDRARLQLQGFLGDLNAYISRYPDPKRGASLFDNQLYYYRDLFGGGSIEDIYSFIGLKPGATAEEIIAADSLYSKKFVKGTPEGDRARNAGYILRNAVSKETYDAFVKDFNALKSRGIDPLSAVKTQEQESYLSDPNRSNLARLQITEETNNELRQNVAFLVTESMSELGTFASGVSGQSPEDFPPLLTSLAALRVKLDEALEKLEQE